jgi:hypothetical protein
MPANPSTTEMGRRHVEHVAEVLGITPSAASGSQWQNPADGRSAHDIPYPVAIECKSTRGKSLTETLDMIAKLREQALGENPVLSLRWYGTDDLSVVLEDWAAVPLDFLGELLRSARKWAEHEANPPMIYPEDLTAVPVPVPAPLEHLMRRAEEAVNLRKALADAHRELLQAGDQIAVLRLKAEASMPQGDLPQAQFVPRLPWTVVHVHAPGIPMAQVMIRYAPDGLQTAVPVSSARVERTLANRPRLVVNDQVVRDGDLYRDGQLTVRTCHDRPEIEVG